MSGGALADPDHLLRTRGLTRQVEGHVIGCAFSRDNAVAAFATGDGEVHLATVWTPAGQAGDGERWRLVLAIP